VSPLLGCACQGPNALRSTFVLPCLPAQRSTPHTHSGSRRSLLRAAIFMQSCAVHMSEGVHVRPLACLPTPASPGLPFPCTRGSTATPKRSHAQAQQQHFLPPHPQLANTHGRDSRSITRGGGNIWPLYLAPLIPNCAAGEFQDKAAGLPPQLQQHLLTPSFSQCIYISIVGSNSCARWHEFLSRFEPGLKGR